MVPVNALPGDPLANSYVSLQDAAGFLQERLNTNAWFAAENLARLAPALVWATRLLEEQVQWHGQPGTLTQALSWPMRGQVDRLGRTVAQDSIPLLIQRATAVYAFLLLRDQSESTEALMGQQVLKSRKLGDTTITYQDQPQTLPVSPRTGLPAEIRQMLQPYGTMTGGMTVRLVRT